MSNLTAAIKKLRGGRDNLGVDGKPVSDDEKRLRHGQARLNKKVIDRLERVHPQGVSTYKVPLMVDEELHTFTVCYTPAKDFVLPTGGVDDQVITDPVGFDGHFPCSANRNSEDAQNLVVVEVFDEKGTPIRREVRVGTLVPYLEENDHKRWEITKKRCTQAMTMVAAANHKDLPGFQEVLSMKGRQRQETPVDLPVTYICYLSPDQGRRTGIHENEHKMVVKSKEMLDEISGNPVTLTFGKDRGGRNVDFKVKAKMFVFPVNMLAFNEKLAFCAQTLRLADERNDEAMASLIGSKNDETGCPGGEVGEFLASAAGESLSNDDKEELIARCDELRVIITERLYHHAGGRPFHPAEQVEDICLRIKQGILNGCKSAKDRTNNADKSHIVDCGTAHVRRKKADKGSTWQRLGLGKDVVSPEMALNQTSAHMTCGALRQQRANCGKSGYKVDDTARGQVDKTVYRQLKAK